MSTNSGVVGDGEIVRLPIQTAAVDALSQLDAHSSMLYLPSESEPGVGMVRAVLGLGFAGLTAVLGTATLTPHEQDIAIYPLLAGTLISMYISAALFFPQIHRKLK